MNHDFKLFQSFKFDRNEGYTLFYLLKFSDKLCFKTKIFAQYPYRTTAIHQRLSKTVWLLSAG